MKREYKGIPIRKVNVLDSSDFDTLIDLNNLVEIKNLEELQMTTAAWNKYAGMLYPRTS